MVYLCLQLWYAVKDLGKIASGGHRLKPIRDSPMYEFNHTSIGNKFNRILNHKFVLVTLNDCWEGYERGNHLGEGGFGTGVHERKSCKQNKEQISTAAYTLIIRNIVGS